MMQKISPARTSKLTLRTPTTASKRSSTSALSRPSLRMAASASAARLPKIFQTSRTSMTLSFMGCLRCEAPA